MFSTKTSAAGLSVASNSLLILLKFIVGIATGSVSVIAEAIHSLIDLVAALIAFFSLRAAVKPADEEHPFGHGKLESISGSVEGLLIFGAAGLIIYEAIQKLIKGAQVDMPMLGVGVMLVSVVVNLIVSRHLFKIARRDDSVALEADALHLSTDVLTSLGVMLGLLVVQFTKLYILDPIIAMGVALLIVRAAYNITKKSVLGLLDTRLPTAEEERIKSTISSHCGALLQMPEFCAEIGFTPQDRCSEIASFHMLRTRKSGSERHIDLHLVVAKTVSVEQADKICDHLEKDIKKRFPTAHITIHVEPCDGGCDYCAIAHKKS